MRDVCVLAAAVIFAVSCSSGGNAPAEYDAVYYAPGYACGFDIVGYEDSLSRVVRVKAAWQGADSTAMELFISRGGERPPAGYAGQVIEDHASRLAVMSSSYIGFLACLDACDSVVAVSGKHFIADGKIKARSDEILEIGSDADPDYEGLVSAGADLVLIYGITSGSPMEKKLASLGIPYMYMGEYLEPDPLGRAEWMVALAEILGDREKGESAFRLVEERYDSLRRACSFPASEDRPAVMLNAPYGDTWFMSSPQSAIVRMIEDAGGRYVYHAHETNMSMPVSREEAFLLASEADFWLDTGSIRTLRELETACPGFSSVECVREGNVYNNDARLLPSGGNEFWETSPARPDLVLSDLIRIFRGGGSGARTDSLYYYRRLE